MAMCPGKGNEHTCGGQLEVSQEGPWNYMEMGAEGLPALSGGHRFSIPLWGVVTSVVWWLIQTRD